MLHDLNKLQGYDIAADDGSIGSVHDVYFDDRYWTIRYLVVDTGRWLPGRKVLIATPALTAVDHQRGCFEVNLSRDQVKNSPSDLEDLPVSRQREAELHDYYQWPYYWAPFSVGLGAAALPLPVAPADGPPPHEGDPNLRSEKETTGYSLHAEDGDIGHVETFLCSDEHWLLPYFVVDTRNWLPGRKVLIGTSWIDKIDWNERYVSVKLSREVIKASPEYDPDNPPARDYEELLHRHYQQPHYWDS